MIIFTFLFVLLNLISYNDSMGELELIKYLKVIKSEKYYHDWFELVKPILLSVEFQKRIKFKHHYNSVFYHCILVSYRSYEFAIKHNVNPYNCAIAGLLHDFYPYAWQDSKALRGLDANYSKKIGVKKKFFEKHGFTHAREALENVYKYYPEYSNDRIDNAILRHMFPLNIAVPKYKESWVITTQDKIVSIKELLGMY